MRDSVSIFGLLISFPKTPVTPISFFPALLRRFKHAFLATSDATLEIYHFRAIFFFFFCFITVIFAALLFPQQKTTRDLCEFSGHQFTHSQSDSHRIFLLLRKFAWNLFTVSFLGIAKKHEKIEIKKRRHWVGISELKCVCPLKFGIIRIPNICPVFCSFKCKLILGITRCFGI